MFPASPVVDHASRSVDPIGYVEGSAVEGSLVEGRSYKDWTSSASNVIAQLGPVLPRFVTLYKPFGQVAALGLGALRTLVCLQEIKNVSSDGIQYVSPRLVCSALFEVAAVAGTVFAHPVGMLLIAFKDLGGEINLLMQHLDRDQYHQAAESGAKILTNALYLAFFVTGGASFGIASLALQIGLGVCQAQQAYSKGNYVEVAAHLCLTALQGRQLSQLAAQMRTSQSGLIETQHKESIDSTEKPESVAAKEVRSHEYSLKANTAQYKNSDYSNAVRVERGITLDQAKAIADADAEIAYFFRIKGGSMVLEMDRSTPYQAEKDPLHLVNYTYYIYDNGYPGQGHARVFHHGDTVFFRDIGKMWLGTAPGLADTYVKSS